MRRTILAVAAVALTATTLTACGGSQPAAAPTTPKACISAMHHADKAFALAGQGFSYASDAIQAASDLDVNGLTTASDGLTTLQPQLQAALDAYKSARDTCEGGDAA